MGHKKILIGFCIIILLVIPLSFASQSNYETSTTSNITNDYPLAIASFIKEKCGNCKDTIILGDDYVVPYYRRDVPMNNPTANTQVYSDSIYAVHTSKPIAEIKDLFKKKQDVVIITPDNVSDYLNEEIQQIYMLLQSYGSNIDIRTSSTVYCDKRANLGGKTLVVIGNENNNNAIKCLPFIPKFASSISIERNQWAGSDISYAVILQPDYSLEQENWRYDAVTGLRWFLSNNLSITWTNKDSLIACFWDGKFSGTDHPFSYGMTCNLAPVAEVIHDIRDSYHCLLDDDKTDFEQIICGVTYAAAGIDAVTYGLIFTGIGFVVGKGADIGISSIKASLKTVLVELTKELGQQGIKNIAGVMKSSKMVAFDLPKTLSKLSLKIILHPKDTLKGLLHIMQHGKEVTVEAFKFIRANSHLDWDLDSLKGLGWFKKLEVGDGIKITLPSEQKDQLKILGFFGNSVEYSRLTKAKNTFGNIILEFGEDIAKKTAKHVLDFDMAPKTINQMEGGKWTIGQVSKIGKSIDDIRKGNDVMAYRYVDIQYFKETLKQNRIDTDGLRDTLKNPEGEFTDLAKYRFGPKVYTSADLGTALKEVESISQSEGFEFRVLFESKIKNADISDLDVVPSAKNLNGININGNKFDGDSIFELMNGAGKSGSEEEIFNLIKNKEFKLVKIDLSTGKSTEKILSGEKIWRGEYKW